MEWRYSENNKSIELVEKPKRFKYLTGTRFASALGLSPYSSPFQIWCECTRLVTPPFEETIYLKAGRTIEPLQREYVSKKFPNIVGPEEYFGDIFEQVRWNFFKDEDKPFAGCWDAVSTKDNHRDIAMVVEGLDRVLFVASFLDKLDYAHPEQFVPNEDNTIMVVKKLKDILIELDGEYLTIDDVLEKAKEFWDRYVVTGISPEFDEKLDKEYLDIIRTSQPINDNSLEDLCDRAKELSQEIEELKEDSGLNSKEKELKIIEDNIKKGLMDSLQDGETKTSCKQYKLSGTVSYKFNEKLFKEKYPKKYEEFVEEKTTYRLSKIKVGEKDE